MIDLSSRQLEFIRLMLEEDEYRSILYFSKQLKVSDKTLKEDLKGIRAFLNIYHMEIRGKTGRGILIDHNVKNDIHIINALKEEQKEMKQESSQARRLHILKSLLLHSGTYTSIQKLSEEYYVSKASIVNDMKYVEGWLGKHKLELEKTGTGTRIKGNESDIRKAIVNLIQENQEGTGDASQKYLEYSERIRLDDRTLSGLSELFRIEDIVFIENLLTSIEMESRINIGDIYFVNLLTHILLCVKRVKEGIYIEENRVGMIRTDMLKQYRQAQKITRVIEEKYRITIGEEETYYIYQYLISSGLEELTNRSREDDYSLNIAMELTQYISEVVNMDFRKDKELLNGLLLHIRPMLNRLEYNIQISNPLLEEIRQWYPQMLGVCQIIISIVLKKYRIKEISIDEAANIATYYQTMMVRLLTPKKVLVVCHSGYGTSQLLAAKLQHEISFIKIADVVSSRKIETMNLEEIDFIISTVPIHLQNIPYIMISALLTDEDIQNIKNSMYGIADRERESSLFTYSDRKEIKKIIYVNENRKDFKTGRVMEKVRFTSRLLIGILEEPAKEPFIVISIENRRQGKEEIQIMLSVTEDKLFKKVLSDIYHLSLCNSDMEKLMQCHNEKEVRRFLAEGR